MSVKTYKKLEKIVAPVLINFHDDLRKHDYNTLKKNDTPFVYAYRPTGTDLLLMLSQLDDYKWKNEMTIEEKKMALEESFIFIDNQNRNFYFLHFDGFNLHKRTLVQLHRIWFSHIDKIVNRAICLEQ